MASEDLPSRDERFMRIALEEAELAFAAGEVPVGAVLVDAEGQVLARAHNRTVTDRDPTAHAEILALREGAGKIGNYRLTGSSLYVTVEPCCMCAGALVWARVGRLVSGAADPKGGGAGSLYRITEDERLNHRVETFPGVLEAECRAVMQRFFRERR
jgi:tRNA(adenine34) deaminase